MLNDTAIRAQKGVALVLCLILATVFAAISIYTSEKEQQQLKIFMGLQQKIEQHNIAHTLAQRLHYSILTNQPFTWEGDTVSLNGISKPITLPYPDAKQGEIKLTIQDASGLLSIVSPNVQNFVTVINKLQNDKDLGQKFIDAWFDWEDKDNLSRLNGKEKDEFSEPPYLPRNSNIQSLSELKLIWHMTPQLYKKLEPHLTYFSRSPFDPALASDELRQILRLPRLSKLERKSTYSTLKNGLVVEQFQSFKIRMDIQGQYARFQRQYVINYRPNDVRLVSISEFGD